MSGKECERIRAVGYDRSIWQLGEGSGNWMPALAATFQTLGMENRIHSTRRRKLFAPCRSPASPESFSLRPPAEEAGTVAGGERDRLVEEEKLRPAPPAHHSATTPLEIAGTDQPGIAGPAPAEKRLCLRIVYDAAIAREKAALRDGDDLAEGGDTVLKRHDQPENDFLSRPFVP